MMGLSAIADSEAIAADLMRQTLGEAEGQLDDIYLKSQGKFFEAIQEAITKT